MKSSGFTILLACLAGVVKTTPARAADEKYIVVRLDEVSLIDCGDGNEGEIVYMTMGATGNHGRQPIAIQQTSFPVENWYEGEDDGVNAVFMTPGEQAVPVFCYPESKMGDELAITISVADDDETSDFVIIGHAVLAKVGTAVATYFLGPAGGKAVDELSSAVQKEIERGGKRDHLGTLSVSLKKSANDGSTFGLPRGEHYKVFERTAGKVKLKYSVTRIAKRERCKDWGLTVTLDKVKIVDDSDDFTQGDGEIYIRTRVADGFVDGEAVAGSNASLLNQTTISLPRNGRTKDVGTGDFFPEKDVKLYSNIRNLRAKGLPVFLYVEVDVFEDDSQADCSGRTCDDVLGVLPLMLTQHWMRDHPGKNELVYDVRGDSGKARIYLTVEVTPSVDPNADPDGPISRR